MLDLSSIDLSVLDAVRGNPALRYVPGRDHEAFHRSTHKRRLIRAGNQSGKTQAATKEADWYCTGTHPFKATPPPPLFGLVLVADEKNGWANWSAKLREFMAPGVTHDRCNYTPDRGFTVGGKPMLMYGNGSRIEPRSGMGGVVSLASVTCDFLVIDEVPKRSHFGEALSRVAVRAGDVWAALTPIGRPVDWFRDHLEGDEEYRLTDGARGEPPREDWEQHILELCVENCHWRTPEDIEAQKAAYGPWEYAQRVHGAWEGESVDRWFQGFGADSVVDEVPKLTAAEFGVFVDHGEKIGHEAAVLVVWQRPSGTRKGGVWVIDEYVNTTQTSPDEDAAGILSMLDRHGLEWSDIGLWVGDVNSGGKSVAGTSVNELLADAIGRATYHPAGQSPIWIDKPRKGAGSVEQRYRILNSAFLRGDLHVHSRCLMVKKCFTHFAGQEDLKHFVDAVGYGVVPVLESWKHPGWRALWLKGR